MTKIKYGSCAVGSLLLAALTLLVPLTASAQDDEGPNFLSVRVVTTHAGSGDVWVAQQRKFAEVSKKNELPQRDVWQEIRGDLDTFHIVTYNGALAEYDTAPEGPAMGEAQAEWVAAIGPTVKSRRNVLLRIQPDLAIPNDEDAEPGLLVLRYNKVAVNKHDQFHDWVKDQLLPALKKGGAKGINFNRVTYGGDNNVWVSSSYIPNFAALDGAGPLAHLSDDEEAALFANFADMVESSEIRILQHRADMSH